MKNKSWISFFLVICFILNLLLTYLLIDARALYNLYQQFTNIDQQTKLIDENHPSETNYYRTVEPTMDQVLAPCQIIVNQEGQLYWLPQHILEELLKDVFNQPFVEITQKQARIDAIELNEHLSKNHVQFIFPNKMPLAFFANWVKIPIDTNHQFAINRIVLSRGKDHKVYLVDSINKAYLEGKYDPQKMSDEFLRRIDKTLDQAVMVDEYAINRDSVYLPKQHLTSPSQVYTLEKIPENLFINPVFKGENFDITESQEEHTRLYHNYNKNLMIDDNTNILIMSQNENYNNQMTQKDLYDINLETKIKESLKVLKNFEYWRQGLRVFSENQHQIVYRRYLGGLPIFPQGDHVDYGAVKISLTNHVKRINLNQLQLPILTLGVNVDDQSRPVDIETGAEIQALLDKAGLKFSQFNQIVLGFEWQANMENFKKVELVPKWFFIVGNRVYSIDQIKNGFVREDLAKKPSETDSVN
ncbi:two-component system activity regulator YycH [Facklamia hominis]|uniref:Regulatory protein YycH domain-containing protein n=2 Tax=Facklamia hominis TaxID=178214 RepID=K1LXV8_9LACT|nr:two-component system activity regulator YycH [Facklamia hominis]EKB54843.1 hypothetical protein HMPREF9706_01033 [Facklamia hominis CCUG 36813]MDK7187671.1 two-component system activity regulator YycH [Facklamia hominis]